jgi:hypothetical protein
MSDVAQGPNWWIASDGKWYPPELHPSVREQKQTGTGAGQTTRSSTKPANGGANGGKVGPQFPDLFQVAMKGSSVADTVTVVSQDPHEYRPLSAGGAGSSPTYGTGTSLTGTPAVATDGGSSKRKWRKSR